MNGVAEFAQTATNIGDGAAASVELGAEVVMIVENGMGAKQMASRMAAKRLASKAAQKSLAKSVASSKPPLPPPQSGTRYSWPGHKNAALAEEELARTVQSLPDEAVVRWGDPIGTHGSDAISVNMKNGNVTLWDSKFRSGNVAVQPSQTFKDPARLQNAIREAEETIRTNTSLPAEIRQKALDNLASGRVTTRTVGAGNARNSTLE
jgi:filamentous hemagglutinin